MDTFLAIRAEGCTTVPRQTWGISLRIRAISWPRAQLSPTATITIPQSPESHSIGKSFSVPITWYLRREVSRRFEGIEKADYLINARFFNRIENNPGMTRATYNNNGGGSDRI
jgi:hypothetical protein